MLKHFLLIVIFLLLSVDSFAREPETTAPIIRGDGNLIDSDGFIIGIRNQKDERANNDAFYYYGVDREGNVTDYSLYKVYNTPETGLVQERLVEEVKDYSKVLAESSNSENAIIVYDGEIFFNGAQLESGSVASGGIVTYVGGRLYYNGKEIENGTRVLSGEIIAE
jgi:hypothetical protein